MKILICGKLDEEGMAKIHASTLDVTHRPDATAKDVLSLIPDFDVLVTRSHIKITREIINAGQRLKLIIRTGVGVDNIDVAAAKEKGVDVRNTPTAATVSAAEHTIGLMIALARNIPQSWESLRSGRWERNRFVGSELMNKTLGLIGFGRIGQEVAKRAEAFGMKVVAYDPLVNPVIAQELGILLLDLDAVLMQSDYVSLHIPLTPQTKNMLNAEHIAKMKKGARVINCSRGGTIDEEALANAIREGHIAGAAFDVFEKEPPSPENPLLKLDRFIAVQHLGAQTFEAQARVGTEVAKMLVEYGRRGN